MTVYELNAHFHKRKVNENLFSFFIKFPDTQTLLRIVNNLCLHEKNKTKIIKTKMLMTSLNDYAIIPQSWLSVKQLKSYRPRIVNKLKNFNF